jgi:hypothetical protein
MMAHLSAHVHDMNHCQMVVFPYNPRDRVVASVQHLFEPSYCKRVCVVSAPILEPSDMEYVL